MSKGNRLRAQRAAAAAAPDQANPKRGRIRERVISNVREMMNMAKHGFSEATGPNPLRRRPGLMNLFTYGRSVTFAIQTMKALDPDFDSWWKPYQDQMQADPLMKYFNQTRTDVLHEGELTTTNYTHIGKDGPVDVGAVMQQLAKHAPPNTISTFIGDQLGGDGWVVLMPDGTKQKIYFQLPEDSGIESGLMLVNPPTEHDGQPIADTSIRNLGTLYLARLESIVSDFVARYSR